MGISSQAARLILREHRFRPIAGRLVSIGRQTVYLTPSQAVSVVEEELEATLDIDPARLAIDSATRGAKGRGFISDRAFFSLFSTATYHCLDQSDYEQADIVFDLCDRVGPGALENGFDFVFDGSTLDNLFDPAAALRNLVRMTAPGGRLFHINHAARRHNEYAAFALSWFHDYYSVNEFDDCQVYLAQWDGDQVASRWDLYHYSPLRERDGLVQLFGQDSYYYPWRYAHSVVVAEKGSDATWAKSPIQFQYRPNTPYAWIDGKFETLPQDLGKNADDAYVRAALRFSRSKRPLLLAPHEKIAICPDFMNYAPQIAYCGSIQAVCAS